MKMSNKNNDFVFKCDLASFYRAYQDVIDKKSHEHEMTAVEKFKKGRKIKIKKENIGSFTRYCGGNVTDECIRKGKHSSDPKIRKRATFAANSRKWPH